MDFLEQAELKPYRAACLRHLVYSHACLRSRQEEFHIGSQQLKLHSIILSAALYEMLGFVSLDFIACDQASKITHKEGDVEAGNVVLEVRNAHAPGHPLMFLM